MPSAAFRRWDTIGQQALDEIEAAHRAVGGGRRGRRYATLRLNHAYTVLLSSQFQAFCRDLHSEAAQFLATATQAGVRPIVLAVLTRGRKLDAGNPNPGNLGSDFERLGMTFWPAVNGLDRRNAARQALLEQLNTWRNAIAHQDWGRVGPALRVGNVRAWRSACRSLSWSFDRAVQVHLAALVGTPPW